MTGPKSWFFTRKNLLKSRVSKKELKSEQSRNSKRSSNSTWKTRRNAGEIQDKLRLEQPHPAWHAGKNWHSWNLWTYMKQLQYTAYHRHILLQFVYIYILYTVNHIKLCVILKVVDTAASVLHKYSLVHQSLTKIPRMHLYASHEAETALKKRRHHSSPRAMGSHSNVFFVMTTIILWAKSSKIWVIWVLGTYMDAWFWWDGCREIYNRPMTHIF